MSYKETVLQLHFQGLSIGQIAEKLEMDSEVVRNVIAQQWADDKDGILMSIRVACRRRR